MVNDSAEARLLGRGTLTPVDVPNRYPHLPLLLACSLHSCCLPVIPSALLFPTILPSSGASLLPPVATYRSRPSLAHFFLWGIFQIVPAAPLWDCPLPSGGTCSPHSSQYAGSPKAGSPQPCQNTNTHPSSNRCFTIAAAQI